ncbi:N-acetylglucosamine kinase [Pseudopedobacter saltans DSM 12145]|uniref:N-acetylglucosamine kinase n=1 Tax=Pseudopedobacter saltans (strain ATCC 51119 / DSM 12145 / JCM 21818 / CCUG 39354 / LMG 10337 / NBRC 100064 / NCIMB 13643) TaxID=762903 RepID=F0S8P7_PSESL|nr:N-acetylglucosamine kinase [Pseudopedobacter saltans]ADY52378.1 N-acetylglucosamine kinase [Pseudopedobacter saltans DSM 12145]
MILIADGGSTKTSWCLIDKNENKTLFNTEGYNPYFSDTTYIYNSLKRSLPKDLPLEQIEEVNYYGAGVHNEEKAKVISDAFKMIFVNAKIDIGHDLLAAARALLKNEKGFAAILGTGTNTCIYDGNDIVEHIDSLAYILGDEGSGCHIGKKLLGDYIRGYMPAEVRKEFWDTFKLTEDEILDNVYIKPLPNRFCASFSKFVYEVQSNKEYTRNLVKSSFEEFFKNLVSRYANYKEYSFNCIGSVAYNFKDILEEVATEYGMKLGNIVRSPIDDLVKFHQERFLSGK